MTLKTCLHQYQIHFELGNIKVGPETDAPLEKLLQELDRLNESARLPGLADRLNANMIDKDKCEAFLSFFPHLPSEDLAPFRQTSILLEDEELGLSMVEPILPAQFQAGYTVEITGWMYDTIMLLRLHIARDEQLATSTILEVKQALAKAEKEVQRLEELKERIAADDYQALRKLLDEISFVKATRSALSAAWLRNAKALLGLDPQNESYQTELREAEHTHRSYFEQPSMGGMP
ncbi:MAG: hypothetical protein AAF587_15670 [Bacteroidota bacterium]